MRGKAQRVARPVQMRQQKSGVTGPMFARFFITRMRGIAQYAVFEANAKVNGRDQISHTHPPKTP